MRVIIYTPRRVGDLHPREQGNGSFTRHHTGDWQMGAQHLGDLITNAKHRVQARQRVLEHHANPRTAAPAQFLRREPQ